MKTHLCWFAALIVSTSAVAGVGLYKIRKDKERHTRIVDREREQTAFLKAENDILRARIAQMLKMPVANSNSRVDFNEFVRRAESDYWHQVESEIAPRGSTSKFPSK